MMMMMMIDDVDEDNDAHTLSRDCNKEHSQTTLTLEGRGTETAARKKTCTHIAPTTICDYLYVPIVELWHTHGNARFVLLPKVADKSSS